MNIVRNMTSGRSVSPRIVVETKVFRTMERCAVLQATRRALCLRNHLILSAQDSQAYVQVLSRTITSRLVTKLEAPRISRRTMRFNKRYGGEVLSTPADLTAPAHDSTLRAEEMVAFSQAYEVSTSF